MRRDASIEQMYRRVTLRYRRIKVWWGVGPWWLLEGRNRTLTGWWRHV